MTTRLKLVISYYLAMSEQDFLVNTRNEIEHYILTNVIENKDNLDSALRYIVSPIGKCLRGFLVLETADMLSVSKKQSMALAAAVELLHAYSLVHDDMPPMDDAELRREKSCCHIKFDEATALLAGNYLMNASFNLISEYMNSSLIKLFTHAIGMLIKGQHMDLKTTYAKIKPSQVMRLYQYKTAELFRVSCIAVAFNHKISSTKIKYLSDYGFNLGMAFQTLDDLEDNNIPNCFTVTQMQSMVLKFLNTSIESLKKSTIPNSQSLVKITEYMQHRCTLIKDDFNTDGSM